MKVITGGDYAQHRDSSQRLRPTVRRFWALVSSTPQLATGAFTPGPMN